MPQVTQWMKVMEKHTCAFFPIFLSPFTWKKEGIILKKKSRQKVVCGQVYDVVSKKKAMELVEQKSAIK